MWSHMKDFAVHGLWGHCLHTNHCISRRLCVRSRPGEEYQNDVLQITSNAVLRPRDTADISDGNPNTRPAPIFRSRLDLLVLDLRLPVHCCTALVRRAAIETESYESSWPLRSRNIAQSPWNRPLPPEASDVIKRKLLCLDEYCFSIKAEASLDEIRRHAVHDSSFSLLWYIFDDDLFE